MHEFLILMASVWHDPVQRARLTKVAFVLTVVYAGALFWLAPYPPMVDLPQHAGQVALWRELLLAKSPWQSLVRINYFTPYLIGYGLALPLSFFMPVAAALKLLLTLAFYAFVFCCVLLRRRFEGDERLDWLFIPGFFGFAYAWGLFTFLVAAPLGLTFVLLADRYAERTTIFNGVTLCAVGLLLFFSHGLVFMFACTIGVALLVVRRVRLSAILLALLPYMPLGTLSIAYALISNNAETAIATVFPLGAVWHWDWRRLLLPHHVFGAYEKYGAIFAPVAIVLMLWAPRLLVSRLNGQQPAAFAPMGVMLVVWLVVPFYAMKTTFLYERFALFVLPFYALMFRRPATDARNSQTASAEAQLCQVVLAALCWVFLAVQTQNLMRFARESEEFNTVRAAAEPGQRALAMVYDAGSTVASNPWAYLHYPLWYQAENYGFVDFNFAWFPPQIVRFRSDHLPAVQPNFSMGPKDFNWVTHHGRNYRYFFVRHTQPLPASLFDNAQCHVNLIKSDGRWSLYETRHCK